MNRRTSILGLLLLSALAWLAPACGTGIMLPKGPDIPALAIKSHRVKVVISDQVARTQVEQVFLNNTDQQLEATFIFPLPAGASVSEFAMMMNGKRVVGELLEKNRARGIYTDIVRRMKDPALLEYAGSNLFKASVFPIPPRGEQKIDLSYSEVVKLESGLAEYVFPLKTGERYSRTMDDFSVSVELESKIPLKSVYSPTHTVEVVRKSDTKALVSCEEPRGALDRDFRLLYALSDKDFGLNLLTHRPKDQDGCFLMMIAPKTDVKEAEILPKDVCFVIDTSGSMSGEKMEQARKALEYCVNSLGDKDRFNITRFSTDVEVFSESLKPVGKSARKEAAEFIGKLVARGGTDINFALERTLTMKTDGKRPYLVVFLTDGRPTIGMTEPAEILNNVRKHNQSNTRIFVFGVGLEVNTHLLDQLADQTRATTQYVAPDEDIEVKVSALYDRVSAPVLANLKVELQGFYRSGLRRGRGSG
jgi:Ca-activated chloride channel family protein